LIEAGIGFKAAAKACRAGPFGQAEIWFCSEV